MPTYGFEDEPLHCQVRGCIGTTTFRSRDELAHGLTLCDPMEGENHFVEFLEALNAGTLDEWKARRIGLSEPLESIYEAAKRVRDECGMDLNDAALKRLIDAALTEYRRG